ncbi:MAG: hypothetical protein Q9159_000713 [Coniocarpon cinnabarinum]
MATDTLPLAPPTQGPPTILCCECGVPIDGTIAGAICESCLRTKVDITTGIQREAQLHTCRDCDRWFSPPSQWVTAALESRELLALCLRRLRGLNKARIIDASFVWTEPHSRRVRVKITVQQDHAGAIVQQTFQVEYIVQHYQCPDCAKSYTHNTWRANVQVRQKVPHKRTFLYLEQLILKMNAHRETINIKEVDAGIDFFFAQRNSAEKFVDFLNSVAPVRVKKSQQLISMDVHTSQKSYKFNYSVELVPICKDDLVALPLKLANQLANVAPLVLCHRIGTAVNLIDPQTLRTADLSTHVFWRQPFQSLADVRQLTEFVIMDIELLGPEKGRYALADATVRRAADFGVNDEEYTVRTHLGHLLHPGDNALGYFLSGANFNNAQLDAIQESPKYSSQIPDVILVKKSYPKRKKPKSRNWKLRRMAREDGQEQGPRKGMERSGEEADYEMFLRDVEEDAELRQAMDVYKAERAREANGVPLNGAGANGAANGASGAEEMEGVEGGSDEEDEEDLEIPMDELREEFESMDIEG